METIEEFYHHKFNTYPENIYETIGQFNAFRIEERMKNNEELPPHIRRNFFKIMLFSGENIFKYGHQTVKVSGNTLLFFHPDIPYSYLPLSSDTKGYFCIFRNEFFQSTHKLQLDQLPLFNTSLPPVFTLSNIQYEEAKYLFIKIFQEAQSDYIYKYDLIRNYVSELYYLAMKWTPPGNTISQFGSAGKRITTIFSELLEQQFPIQYKTDTLALRHPKNYAEKLSVHVNYLNRCIKKITGKTTGEYIFERIGTEAKILLRDTDWTISEISEALGFDDLAHFNKFFKKQTGINPTSFRLV
ncbi:AraC family transcriptional regulator [Chryseobacterium sp. BIGb0232]|uniref:helix-turn-helix domain-containing protein n=1 Tax=Chryseobacterium sp. BIGb0232 TaxID=2940598 RepID=UPI000F468F5A|nr:helix-turn-helix domain-containing protein [Chryseobacterium sp. BIGb0232]MCS4304927.1 AraC-like DNA-binding protein [Chryseobacterium sp. BIGb0232]ROS09653.1 helix-turn-helix protein [Chryseobacterium nakagawai]